MTPCCWLFRAVAGMIGPAACWVVPAVCCVLPAVGWVLPAARPEDVAVAEQALTPSTAAMATVSAAAIRPPWDGRPPGRDIDMSPIMPDAIRCLALIRPDRWRPVAVRTPRRGGVPR